jgi:L1 cell adhesion molecule like protein
MIKDTEFPSRRTRSSLSLKQEIGLYISQVEATITSPEVGMKIKQNEKAAVETELSKAHKKLEIEGESYILYSLGNFCPF